MRLELQRGILGAKGRGATTCKRGMRKTMTPQSVQYLSMCGHAWRVCVAGVCAGAAGWGSQTHLSSRLVAVTALHMRGPGEGWGRGRVFPPSMPHSEPCELITRSSESPASQTATDCKSKCACGSDGSRGRSSLTAVCFKKLPDGADC